MNSLHNPRKGRTRSRSRAKNGRIEKEWCSKQALSPPTKNILLWRRLFREIPAGHVDQHHNQVEANIPELGGMVLASLKEIIELNSLVAAFRRSTLVVHQMPLIAFPRWGGIETNIGLHGNSTGSAICGGRAWGVTGTDSVVIQRTLEAA